MKKIFALILAVLVLAVSVGAADIRELIDLAEKNSSQYQNIELSHRKSSMNLLKTTDPGASFELSVGDLPDNVVFEEGQYKIPGIQATLTFPEKIDGLTVSADANLKEKTLGTSISYTKTISSSGYDSSYLADRKAELQLAMDYRKSVLQFENSFIADVYGIMDLEYQVETSKKNYEDSLKSFNNSLILGETVEDSVDYLKKKMNLDQEKVNLDSVILRLENQKEQFFHSYGIEFEGVSCPEEPVLDFEISDTGNTTVYFSYLSMIAAEEKLNSATGKTSGLTFTGSLTPTLALEGSSKKSKIGAKGNISYSSGQFNLTGTVSSDFESDKWSSPKVTISGGWGTGQSTKISEDSLAIDYIQAQSDYNEALYSYISSSKSLLNDVETHKADIKKLELKTEYDSRILQAKQRLYDLGLCTYSEVESAMADVSRDALDKTILALKGIVLANRIEINEL